MTSKEEFIKAIESNFNKTLRIERAFYKINIKDDYFLYIKESNSNPCFWGITKNQVDNYNEKYENLYLLLLNGKLSGYLIDAVN